MYEKQAIGRLTKDCEVRTTPTGKVVCNFTIAVDMGKRKDGSKIDSRFVECAIWGPRAESSLPNYLLKGTQVYVRGLPGARAYINKENQATAVETLDVNDLELLGSSKSSDGGKDAAPTRQKQTAPSSQEEPWDDSADASGW